MTKRKASLAAIAAAAVLFGLVPAAQAQETRVSPNFNLASDSSAFRGRDQIGLGVSRTNPQHVVAINANYLDLECEASVSRDGGSTWSEAVPLLPADPPAGQAPFSKRCNFHQSVVFGSGQNVYAIVTALRSGSPAPVSPDRAVLVYKSTDGGDTWGRGMVVMAEGPGTNDPNNVASPGPSYDKPSIAVDPGAGSNGQDRVYAVARDFLGFQNAGTTPACTASCGSVQVATSTNSGQSYGAPVKVSPVGVSAQDPPPSVVNSDGSVTVGWRVVGRDGMLQVSRSTTQGATWSAPINVAVVRNRARFAVNDSHLPPPAAGPNSSTATFPRMAADLSSPGRAGYIYLVYGDTASPGPTEPPGGFLGSDHFINYDSQVYFQRSKDNGLTWSTPKRISDPTPRPGSLVVQTRHPNVSVSPSGRVNIVWHDRRHWYQPGMPVAGNATATDASLQRTCTHSHIYCEDIRLGDTYLSVSNDAGTSFSDNIRINDRSHNNDVGYDARPAIGYWAWGPQSVTIANDQLLVGFMDTREGNWDNENEDFYLARVNFNATGPDPETNIDQPDAISRSVALSKLGYMGGNEGALVGGSRDPANAGLTITPFPTGVANRNTSMVVIANASDVAGAMAGTVLARANPAPVLLSPAAGLPDSVKSELTRLRPAGAFVIGDTQKLSAQVANDVAAAGVPAGQVVRLSGSNDADTARLIAERMDRRAVAEKAADVPAFDAAVIVNPATPDAAAAVGLAAARRLPLLFVGATSVPAETTAALTALDIKKLLVIGDTNDISSAVVTQLDNDVPSVTDPVTRLGGADPYETSKAVVDESKARGLPNNIVYVANGDNPMDATLLAGVVARATGMLMLAPTPLHSTAASRVAQFGLTGVDRLVLLGPAAPAPPPPPRRWIRHRHRR